MDATTPEYLAEIKALEGLLRDVKGRLSQAKSDIERIERAIGDINHRLTDLRLALRRPEPSA